MDTINALGVSIVLFVQSLGAWMEGPMRFFTFLGSENFFLLVLPMLYWSVNSRLGMQVGYILLFSDALNGLLKMAFAGPRPYWVSAQVKGLATESSFGVPSGHAQLSVVIWGTVAAFFRRAWVWAAAVAVMFLIGLSRVYLGVHFPHDVLLGWLLGAATLWAFTAWWDRIGAWLRTQGFARQVGLALAASLAIILVTLLLVNLRSAYVLSDAWVANILLAGDVLPEPLAMSGVITAAGMLFGLSLGLAWMARRGGFHASGPVSKRVACYLVGLVGVVIFWFGLGEVLPRGETLVPLLLRYFRYALVGFWVTGGAPWLFFRFNLASQA